MASSSTLRSRTEAGTGADVLPIDVLSEILIRLQAEELCRLRVVCRPWRSLLSDPQFVAAHAARHQGRPLIVARNHDKSFCNDGILCRIIDLSGRIIKQIPSASENEWLLSTSTYRNLAACTIVNNWRLLNLVTGERFPLPKELSQEYVPRRLDTAKFYTLYMAFVQVASTGELKVVRVIDSCIFKHPREQLWEVFTLGDPRWRGKKAPQYLVDTSPLRTVVAIDGVVYFLLYSKYVINGGQGIKAIASFELQTEEWRSILQGPASVPDSNSNVCLVDLNGSLVLVHCWPSPHFLMDLWFLMDFDKALWLKQHSVEFKLGIDVDFFDARPLVILKNGMIVIHIRSTGLLTIYNPRTNTYTDVGEIGFTNIGIGLYTGNLLSLTNDDAI